MKRNPATARLSKDFIESKVSQEAIVSRYLDIPLEVVKDCIFHNRLITSVFRDDDTNQSMGIQYNNKGKLKVRDFGGFGFFDDVYGVVAYVLSIIYKRPVSTSNKQDFYFVLKHIAMTFSDIIYGNKVDPDVKRDLTTATRECRKRKARIEIAFRSWNKADSILWKRWRINLTYLDTHFVYPVDQYYINRTSDITLPDYYYNVNDPAFAYFIGRNDRLGEVYWKLYFPLRDKKKNLKFITNISAIEGWYNLENIKYDYILITKSSKDRLAIGCHLANHPLYGGDKRLNIGIVNLPSENYELHKEEYYMLLDRVTDYNNIYSLLDFDTAGRCGAKKLQTMWNIKYLFITRGEFGLPNYKCKDFAELEEMYTEQYIISLVEETLKYVQYRKTNEYTDSSIPY